MIVREPSADDIAWICEHLRDEDRREQFAPRFDDDPGRLANEHAALAHFAIKQIVFCTGDGEPAIFMAAYLKAPAVASLTLFATPRMVEIARQAHRWGLRRFIPFVLMPNVRLAETRILADHAGARRWVRSLGFVEVGPPLPFGRNGEMYVHVAWINGGGGGHVLRRTKDRPGRGEGGAGSEPQG